MADLEPKSVARWEFCSEPRSCAEVVDVYSGSALRRKKTRLWLPCGCGEHDAWLNDGTAIHWIGDHWDARCALRKALELLRKTGFDAECPEAGDDLVEWLGRPTRAEDAFRLAMTELARWADADALERRRASDRAEALRFFGPEHRAEARRVAEARRARRWVTDPKTGHTILLIEPRKLL